MGQLEKQNHTGEPMTDKALIKLYDLVQRGHTLPRIARRLAPRDKRQQKYWRQRLTKAMNDPRMQILIHQDAHAQALAGLPRAIKGAVRRAEQGRMDAVKFIAEVSRFHSPRIQHDHSGDITITIDMPRPKRLEEPIPDAEVVEE